MALLGGSFALGGPITAPSPTTAPVSTQVNFNAVDPLGVDVFCYHDLDASFALVSGYTALGQSLARRLETPRGGLFYDSSYGTDLREMVNDVATQASAQRRQQQIEAEALKDERVATATATVTYSAATQTAIAKLVVGTAQGPFTFVLAVTALSVSLLPIG